MNKNRWVMIVLVVLILITPLWGIYMHEFAHHEIFAADGIDSHYEINWQYAMTVPERDCVSDVCRLSNNFNEVVGYNTQAITMILVIGFVALIIMRCDD
jgi:hypothetical protein